MPSNTDRSSLPLASAQGHQTSSASAQGHQTSGQTATTTVTASPSAPLPFIYISDEDDDFNPPGRGAGTASWSACIPESTVTAIGYPVIWGRAIRNAAVTSMQIEGPVNKQPGRCTQSTSWILFALGFLCPLCWMVCICLPAGKNKENKRPAVGSAIMLIVYAVLVSLVMVFSLSAGSCTQHENVRTCYNRITGVVKVEGPGVSYTGVVDPEKANQLNNIDWGNMEQATANWKQFFAG